MRPFPSPVLKWLKEGWLGEYDSGLGPPLALHVRGRTAKAAAPLVERAARLVDSRHVLWVVERDLRVSSPKGHSLPVKRDPQGHPIRHAIEWVQPFHEGVKRIAPRIKDGDKPHTYQGPARRAALLRYWLNARGYNDAGVIYILSIATAWTTKEVAGAIERAGREAAALIGDERAGPIPWEGLPSGASRGNVPPRSGGARHAPIARPGQRMGSPDAGIRRSAPRGALRS